MDALLTRITLNPATCNGKPTIRNMRFTVAQMLELLASGMTAAEILDDYPFIEQADIDACFKDLMQLFSAQLPLIVREFEAGADLLFFDSNNVSRF